MIDEARAFSEMRSDTTGHEFRVGVSAGPGALPSWKREADYLFAQVRYSIDDFMRWRSSIDFDGPVYAGVMLVPSVAMARKISAEIRDLAVPDSWMTAIDADPTAGVTLACDLVIALKDSGAFDGAHLIPVSRYREVAATLEAQLGGKT